MLEANCALSSGGALAVAGGASRDRAGRRLLQCSVSRGGEQRAVAVAYDGVERRVRLGLPWLAASK
jgi:hypothetical protein